MNYRYWSDRQEKLCEASEGETLVIEDNVKAQVCPKCTRLMTKFQIGASTTNRLDLCAGCDEVWLDKGEWQLLRMLDHQHNLQKIFTDAWQRSIRVERQVLFQKSRYQSLLGDDGFGLVDEFKAYLDGHEHRADILQYLTIRY